MHVAQSAFTPTSDSYAIFISRQISNYLIIIKIGNPRPGWYQEFQILSRRTSFSFIGTVLSTLGFEGFAKTKRAQGIEVVSGVQYDIATLPPIATVWTTTWDKLFPPPGDNSVPTITGF